MSGFFKLPDRFKPRLNGFFPVPGRCFRRHVHELRSIAGAGWRVSGFFMGWQGNCWGKQISGKAGNPAKASSHAREEAFQVPGTAILIRQRPFQRFQLCPRCRNNSSFYCDTRCSMAPAYPVRYGTHIPRRRGFRPLPVAYR
jgi:hypothetical protein